ncbi:hydrogenase iron-sulfur subunit [Chloroflexota bacterium]
MKQQEPKIVCFSCKFSWGYLNDENTMAANIENWIPIICCGKLDAQHIMDAFANGANGVLILGCPEGDCHYQDGNLETKKRIALLKSMMASYGIEPERIKLVLSSDPEGKTIPGLVAEMSKAIKKLKSENMVKA